MLFRSLFIILLITVSPLSHAVLMWGPSGGPYMPTAGGACEAFAATLGHDDQYGIPIKTRLDGPFGSYYTCTVDYMNSGYSRTRSTSLYQWDRPSCPEGFEQQGSQCVPAVPPKVCPTAGTAASGPINLTIGSGGSVPSSVLIDGCIYSIPTHGHPDVDGSGNNCITNADGSLNCFFSGTSDGKTGDECAPADCPVVPPPITEPVQTKPSDTSTETKTDPATGGTNKVDTEIKTELLPDGTRKETTTETHTQTVNGQTTTTTTTTVVHHYQDGRQVTTTNKTTTKPDGTTSTELTGTSETGPKNGVNTGDQAEGKGQCDPTKPDYLQCVKLIGDSGEFQGLSEVKSWWEPRYENGASDVVAKFKTQINQSAFMSILDPLKNLPSSGSEPAWNFNINLGAMGSYTGQLALPSGVWAFIRFCILFTAAMTARRLVFGG